MLNLVTKL